VKSLFHSGLFFGGLFDVIGLDDFGTFLFGFESVFGTTGEFSIGLYAEFFLAEFKI
jgi:hypothetical protein